MRDSQSFSTETISTAAPSEIGKVSEKHHSSKDIRILHGEYVGSKSSSKGRLKNLQLRRNEDEVTIKLPKSISHTLTGKLQPGMMLQVWVRPKKDHLKALMVMPGTMPTGVEVAIEEQPDAASEHQVSEAQPSFDTPSSQQSPVCTLKVCTKGKCYKQGGRQVLQALEDAVKAQDMEGAIAVQPTGCLKNCKKGPTVKASSDSKSDPKISKMKSKQYSFVRPQDVPQILQRHAGE